MRTQPNLLALVALTIACNPYSEDKVEVADPSSFDGGSEDASDPGDEASNAPEDDGDGEASPDADSDADTDGEPDADDEPDTDADDEPDADTDGDAEPDEPDTDGGFSRLGSIDESCDTLDPGHSSATDDAIEAIDRTNCYRNLMGIERGMLDADLDDASQIHADYMDRHDTLTHWEDPSKAGT